MLLALLTQAECLLVTTDVCFLGQKLAMFHFEMSLKVCQHFDNI